MAKKQTDSAVDIVELERTPEQEYADFKAELDAQPKVQVFIPLPEGISMDKANAMPKPPAVPVALNGVTYLIRQGFPVDVPRSIAGVLRESGIGG